jgi:uncharacterized protein (TIGR00251 family)
MKNIKDGGSGRIRIRVRIQPGAQRNELLGWNPAGELRIKIAAPPREGEANKELVAFLAKRFSVAKRDIQIESGEKSRVKLVSVPAALGELLRAIPLVCH